MKKKLQFEKSFASIDKVKYWSERNDIKPHEISKWSRDKCLFDCEICGHELLMVLSDVTKGFWCGFCANRKLCENEECNTCLVVTF